MTSDDKNDIKYTEKDLRKAFKAGRKEEFYYTLGDDEQKYRPKYKTFEDWITRNDKS